MTVDKMTIMQACSAVVHFVCYYILLVQQQSNKAVAEDKLPENFFIT